MKQLQILLIGILTFFPIQTQALENYSKTENDSLSFKIGQILMVGFRGLELSDTSAIVRDIQQQHLGGVILFNYDVPLKSSVRNIESKAQVTRLVESLASYSKVPLFVAIDQEGGKVQRLKASYGFQDVPSQQHIAELKNLDSTRFYANVTARQLSNLGINVNFAPVVDLNVNPENPIIGKLGRSFSADPEMVIEQSHAVIEVFHKNGILSAIKHFPGHGSSTSDSHLGVVDVSNTWQADELLPFEALCQKGLPDMVMTAHIFNRNLDSEFPATLSKSILQSQLREACNYDGVVVSDDLQMKAISKHYGLKETIKLCLNAGVDLLLFANNSTFDDKIVEKAQAIIKTLIETDQVPMERINEAFERVWRLKKKLQ